MARKSRRTRDQNSILADVRALACEYYEATGKPLGITGELAEYEASVKLCLELADARTAGYDAIRRKGKRSEKVQIKGRRIAPGKLLYAGRVSKIDLEQPFDSVALVLMWPNYEVAEIWEAKRKDVEERLTAPGSKSRNERGSMGISQFKSIAVRVWPTG